MLASIKIWISIWADCFLFNLKSGSRNLPCTSWFNKLLNNYSSVSATNRSHSSSRLFLASVNLHRFLVLQLKRCTSNKMYTQLIVVFIHLILVKTLDQLNWELMNILNILNKKNLKNLNLLKHALNQNPPFEELSMIVNILVTGNNN